MNVIHFQGFAGIRLEADQLGDEHAPPVLMLHGGGQTRRDWDVEAAALQLAGRQVINLDLRGHGGSEWPADGRYDFETYVADLKAVLAQLPARPAIVASSFGAWVATVAVGEDGGHLASALVLADAPAAIDANVARAMGDALRRRNVEEGRRNWDERVHDDIDVEATLARVRAAAAKLMLPVLFVRGAESRIGDRQSAQALVDAIADAELAELEGAGHLAVAERAEEFNVVLLDFLERRAPLMPPEYRQGSDARTFRDALGCFATGVTIVTAMSPDGHPIGLTANSFTSVSLDPPLLLVCIATNAGSASILKGADRFAVNVLQIGQQMTSNRFAGKGLDRFAETDWQLGQFGTPLINGSLSSFECEREAVHDGGDHFILVGKVERAVFEPRRDPLLYFRGKYRRLHFA